MPGTNAGTGQPISFRCSACRRRNSRKLDWQRDDGHGRSNGVTLTGRAKKRPTRGGIRSSFRIREYKCNHCGHVGWSQHIDLERLDTRRPVDAPT